MYERYEKKVANCKVAGLDAESQLSTGTLYDSLVQSLVDVDLIPMKTPPSMADRTREFHMQANPISQPPSAEFNLLLDHHFFELKVSTLLEEDLESSKRSMLLKVSSDYERPVEMDFINPLPEKMIAPEHFDRFRRIIGFHKKFVLEKLKNEALTKKEKYLLHFANAVCVVLLRLKRRGFQPRVDEIFYNEIQEKHQTDINEKVRD